MMNLLLEYQHVNVNDQNQKLVKTAMHIAAENGDM
jgi:hypothetical protein